MSDDCISDNDDVIVPTFTGFSDGGGAWHGRGTLHFNTSGSHRFEGRFVHGCSVGRGTMFFDDGASLSGEFDDLTIHGRGVYEFEDGRMIVGEYCDGALNGYCEEFDEAGDLSSHGYYSDNIRVGVCHVFDSCGGYLFGVVDKLGQFNGNNIVYAYPDGGTFLKGRFCDGDMVQARLAHYRGYGDKNNPFSYVLTNRNVSFKRDVSTSTQISSDPLLIDPMEDLRVFVKPSDIEDGGEGLFAKVSAASGEVMSFYNGIRISHVEVDDRDWRWNNNTISLDDHIVIDVPENLSDTNIYRASLGHKANHSFTPNCMYDPYNHPRFGLIKSIRTIRNVLAGEELTVAYGYDHSKLETDAPCWYREKLKLFQMENMSVL